MRLAAEPPAMRMSPTGNLPLRERLVIREFNDFDRIANIVDQDPYPARWL